MSPVQSKQKPRTSTVTLPRVAGFVLVLAWAQSTQAEVLAHITWVVSPPSECLDPHAVEQTIESRLGRRVFGSAPQAVSIVARFVDRQTRKAVQLEVRSPSGENLGERELATANCEELAASLPVVIAVLLDLDLPAVPATTPPTAPAPPPKPPARERPRAADFALRLRVTPMLQASLSQQLPVTLGGALQLSAAWSGPFEILAWGDGLFKSATQGSPAAVVQSGSLGLAFCAAGSLSAAVSVGGCLGGGAQQLYVRGRGFEMDMHDARWLAVGRALARAEYHLVRWLSVRLESGVSVPWQRHRYVFGTTTLVYRPSLAWLSQIGLCAAWQ